MTKPVLEWEIKEAFRKRTLSEGLDAVTDGVNH